jgi:outer membrane protein OmpA-like peptidoglycan-associated protein
VDCWTPYREFWFQQNSAVIQDSDQPKLVEIAVYMKANPSLKIGIDGSMDPGGTESSNRNLSDQRVKAIRDGLVEAGVPSHRISAGAFGDVEMRRDRRVEVLFTSAN